MAGCLNFFPFAQPSLSRWKCFNATFLSSFSFLLFKSIGQLRIGPLLRHPPSVWGGRSPAEQHLEVPLPRLPGEAAPIRGRPRGRDPIPASATLFLNDLGQALSLAGTRPLTWLVQLKPTCDREGSKSSVHIDTSSYTGPLSPLCCPFTSISGTGPAAVLIGVGRLGCERTQRGAEAEQSAAAPASSYPLPKAHRTHSATERRLKCAVLEDNRDRPPPPPPWFH